MTVEISVALALGLAATVEDVRRRRIPNWIPLGAAASGIVLQGWERGLSGVTTAALGATAGFLVFLIFHLSGGMGAGDIKLMSGFGALLGPAALWEAALWTALAGAIVATFAVLASRRGRQRPQFPAAPRHSSEFIPYAPAIAAGVWITLWVRA